MHHYKRDFVMKKLSFILNEQMDLNHLDLSFLYVCLQYLTHKQVFCLFYTLSKWYFDQYVLSSHDDHDGHDDQQKNQIMEVLCQRFLLILGFSILFYSTQNILCFNFIKFLQDYINLYMQSLLNYYTQIIKLLDSCKLYQNNTHPYLEILETINIINNKMNKKNINFQERNNFPIQDIKKYLKQESTSKKKDLLGNILSSKVVMKNQSKSLYYYNSANNVKRQPLTFVNKTGFNMKKENPAQQTLNQQLLGIQRPKPATSEYRSGRNSNYKHHIDTKNNKISLRSSSNYSKIISIAGIVVDQNKAKQRMENSLNTKQNIRKIKQKQLQKQNQKIARRLDSQQSEYSTKKLLRQFQSHQKISKRLTQSKLSKRSNCEDNRSVCSQNSSRASVRSGQSRNSRTSSMKSTSRANSSKSSSRNGINKFHAKIFNPKKVKIIQHNINKMNQNQLNKFKNLFANSFSTTNNSGKKNISQNANIHLSSYHQKIIKNNPYADIQILSQKSQSSVKQSTDSNNRSKISFQNKVTSANVSNRKLRQINYEFQVNRQQIAKKSSAITSIQNDGLLHRIAEEMYQKNSSTDDLKKKQIHNKKQSNPITKTDNIQKNYYSRGRQKIIINPSSTKGNRSIRHQLKYSLFPTNQMFGNKI